MTLPAFGGIRQLVGVTGDLVEIPRPDIV